MNSFIKDNMILHDDNVEVTPNGVKALLIRAMSTIGVEVDSINDIKFTKNISHPALDTKEYEFDKCKIKISKKVI